MGRASVFSQLTGLILVAALILAVAFTGCASSLETAQKIHSYTPCGMMMNAVMQHPPNGSNSQTGMETQPPQAEPASQPADTAVGEAVHSGH